MISTYHLISRCVVNIENLHKKDFITSIMNCIFFFFFQKITPTLMLIEAYLVGKHGTTKQAIIKIINKKNNKIKLTSF